MYSHNSQNLIMHLRKHFYGSKLHQYLASLLDSLHQGNPPLFTTKVSGCSDQKLSKDLTVEAMARLHFESHSSPDHISRPTIEHALSKLKSKPAVIVETGSSAWGTNSSLLWDSYVSHFGGLFLSTDIRFSPSASLAKRCTPSSTFVCCDSVRFLSQLRRYINTDVDLVYLDSWDVDWSQPIESAIHGLRELLHVLPFIRKGGLLLVDDTPSDLELLRSVLSDREFHSAYDFYLTHQILPGKGSLIKNYLSSNNIGRQIEHGYQLLWQL